MYPRLHPLLPRHKFPGARKPFSNYLGNNINDWLAYDPTYLVTEAQERLPILIDQGDADSFLIEQLQPSRFAEACQAVNHPLSLRMQPGYDHSFYFIASFMGDHIAHHAEVLVES